MRGKTDSLTTGILAEKWHNKSGGAFAASCIGVLLLAVTLESLRHWCKRYDQLVARQLSTPAGLYRLDGGGRTYGAAAAYETGTRRATAFQQLIRALLHVTVVCVGYILMLILMSFNGYLFICTLIGTGIGKYFCDWMVIGWGREKRH